MFIFSPRDTAGQERFRTITTAYYRGAMVSHFIRMVYTKINECDIHPLWVLEVFSLSWCIHSFHIIFSGHHACLRYHKWEVVWKHQELDKKHRGGSYSISTTDSSFSFLKATKWQLQFVPTWLCLSFPVCSACFSWCWKDGAWQQVRHQWQAAGVQRQRGEGETVKTELGVEEFLSVFSFSYGTLLMS